MSTEKNLGPCKDAEPTVREAHARVLQALPFADRRDFEDAARGFIATLPDATILGEAGRTVWSVSPYAFSATKRRLRPSTPASGAKRGST